jgi:dTMP kinase
VTTRRTAHRGAHGGVRPGHYYGHGLIHAPEDIGPGRIIAIEGTDGVGRSTQVRLLREWLEVQGYGVVETGLMHSPLMEPTIQLAKSSNMLNPLTFVLLHACDFADRMEAEIIPALKAGFIVLADRYIYTAVARACVRGVDNQWIRRIYGFALAPHLVFYLKIDPDTLARRMLANGGISYWESGMDMRFGDNIFDNFRSYQRQLLKEYAGLAEEFDFRTLDGRKPIDTIQRELRRQVGLFLASTADTPELEQDQKQEAGR